MIQTLTSIIVMLQLATSLLTASIGTPYQGQAEQFALLAIKTAQETVIQLNTSNMTPVPEVAQQTTPTPVSNESTINMPKQEEQQIITLKIISPKTRKYYTYNWDFWNSTPFVPDNERPSGFIFPNESNSIELELVVRVNNENKRDLPVEITATDSTQNKSLTGTGSITKILEDGTLKSLYYYPFHYEFKTAGDHRITFTCQGVSESVTLNASSEN